MNDLDWQAKKEISLLVYLKYSFLAHWSYLYPFFSAKNLEATIIRDLLDGYEPQAFPFDDDISVVVNVSYFLMQLQGLVSKYCTFLMKKLSSFKNLKNPIMDLCFNYVILFAGWKRTDVNNYWHHKFGRFLNQ